MLDRHIDIVEDLGDIPHRFRDLDGDLLGIAVHQADPLDAFDLRQVPKKLRERLVPIQVGAVEGRLLGHQNQLLDSLGGKYLRLLHQFLLRNAPVAPADRGDDAVCAALVAPFRDLEIAVIASRRDDAVRSRPGPLVLVLHEQVPVGAGRSVRGEDLLQDLGDPALGSGADHGVHFRNLLEHFVLVALRHAARHDQSFQPAFRAQLRQREDLVDALLLCVHDKTARVDDRGVGLVLIVCKGKALFSERSQHFLRIHKILITS